MERKKLYLIEKIVDFSKKMFIGRQLVWVEQIRI